MGSVRPRPKYIPHCPACISMMDLLEIGYGPGRLAINAFLIVLE